MLKDYFTCNLFFVFMQINIVLFYVLMLSLAGICITLTGCINWVLISNKCYFAYSVEMKFI